jgi:AcrR family transcriptional regulator
MPRETLTREQIVDAAIALLDEDGFTGLNMRALGSRLGSAATAVYWHVGSKENLIRLAGDRVWTEISLPDPTEVGWRSAATQMATELHAMLTRHVWLVQAFGSYLLYSPAKARHDDHTLAIYEAADSRALRQRRQPRRSSPSCSATPSARPPPPRSAGSSPEAGRTPTR